jgi:hypothetical protein
MKSGERSGYPEGHGPRIAERRNITLTFNEAITTRDVDAPDSAGRSALSQISAPFDGVTCLVEGKRICP